MSIPRRLQVSARRLCRGSSGERGQTIVMVGVIFMVLVALGAMAVDVGGIMWSRGTQQNAADAAALAGARELPDKPDLAREVALDYAASNGFVDGVDGVTVTAVVSSIAEASTAANNALTVTITRVVAPGLRAAVGAGNVTVPARAVAVVAPAMPVCDYWPWAIEEDTLIYGEDGTIYNSGTDGLPYGKKVVLKVPSQVDVVPGNFLGVRIGDSSGAEDYRETIKTGGCISSTETVWTETGNMKGPTGQGVLQHSDSAILQTDPCYDPDTNPIDSVEWEVSKETTGDYPGPFQSPITGEWTTHPFALGNPCDPSDTPPLSNGNTGPPSAQDPFPTIVLPSTTRVGNILILKAGTFDASNANNGHFEAEIAGAAAFYLIGLESDGSQDFVVGAFLDKVIVKAGTPKFGGDLNGPVGVFLWE